MESFLHLLVAVAALSTVDFCHFGVQASVYFPVFAPEDSSLVQEKFRKALRDPQTSEEIPYPREATTVQPVNKRVTPYYTGDIGKLPLSIPHGRKIGGNEERKRKKFKKPTYLINEEHYPELPSGDTPLEDSHPKVNTEPTLILKEVEKSEARTTVLVGTVPSVLEKPPLVDTPASSSEEVKDDMKGDVGLGEVLQKTGLLQLHAPLDRNDEGRLAQLQQEDSVHPTRDKSAQFLIDDSTKPTQSISVLNHEISRPNFEISDKTQRLVKSDKEDSEFHLSLKESAQENWHSKKTGRIDVAPEFHPSFSEHEFNQPSFNSRGFRPIPNNEKAVVQDVPIVKISVARPSFHEPKLHNWNWGSSFTELQKTNKQDPSIESKGSTVNNWRNNFLKSEHHEIHDHAQNGGRDNFLGLNNDKIDDQNGVRSTALSVIHPLNPHLTNEDRDDLPLADEGVEDRFRVSEASKRKKGERRKVVKKIGKAKTAKTSELSKWDESNQKQDKSRGLNRQSRPEIEIENQRKSKSGRDFVDVTNLHSADRSALSVQNNQESTEENQFLHKSFDVPQVGTKTDSEEKSGRPWGRIYGSRARELNFDPETVTERSFTLGSNQFRCSEYAKAGIYADIESGCKVYHICESNGRAHTFECPSGTLFDQRFLVCAWEYTTSCAKAQTYYRRNDEIYTGKEQHVYL